MELCNAIFFLMTMMTLRHENVFLITGPFVRGITSHHCFLSIKDQWCRDYILLRCHPDLAVEQTAELMMITDDMGLMCKRVYAVELNTCMSEAWISNNTQFSMYVCLICYR